MTSSKAKGAASQTATCVQDFEAVIVWRAADEAVRAAEIVECPGHLKPEGFEVMELCSGDGALARQINQPLPRPVLLPRSSNDY